MQSRRIGFQGTEVSRKMRDYNINRSDASAPSSAEFMLCKAAGLVFNRFKSPAKCGITIIYRSYASAIPQLICAFQSPEPQARFYFVTPEFIPAQMPCCHDLSATGTIHFVKQVKKLTAFTFFYFHFYFTANIFKSNLFITLLHPDTYHTTAAFLLQTLFAALSVPIHK